MKKHLQDIRDLIIYESWEKYKNRISMEELAVFFNVSLKRIYGIIRYLDNKESKVIQVEYDFKGRKKPTK